MTILDLLNKADDLNESKAASEAANQLIENDFELENPMTVRDKIDSFNEDSDLSVNFGQIDTFGSDKGEQQSLIRIDTVRNRHYKQGATDIQDQLLITDAVIQNQTANFNNNPRQVIQRLDEEEKSSGRESMAPERHVFKVPTVEPFNDEQDTYAKILVVDDNAFCLIAVVSLLAQYQIECDQAYNGQQAFEMVRSRLGKDRTTYKLILMDYKMPICNGCDATV